VNRRELMVLIEDLERRLVEAHKECVPGMESHRGAYLAGAAGAYAYALSMARNVWRGLSPDGAPQPKRHNGDSVPASGEGKAGAP
jgi:hypothetical protein